MNEPRDIPGIIAPPPLIALAALVLGLALDWLLPSFILQGVFGFWTRSIIGAILIAAGATMAIVAHRSFVEAGARSLHIVDLDGARAGRPVNLAHLERITGELDVPVQYGEGLRSLVDVRGALAAGASRVVLGTAAYSDVEFLDEVLETWGVRIVVAIDVRGGHVSVSGWERTTQMLPADVIERMQGRGVKQFVYTNVDRDGMLQGPDLDEVRRIGEVIRGRFIYSGGISSLDDLAALRSLRLVNLA